MRKESRRQKAKLRGRQILSIILAVLMISGTIALIISAIIAWQ